MSRRLGFLGGTFDPVHTGHLAMARAARTFAGLERVLVTPCAEPPHKDRTDITDGFRRFAMLVLALQGETGLEASPVELIRGGTSYTVETLRALREDGPEDEIYLIVGSDSFVELETWREHQEILGEAALLVVPRPEADPAAMARRAPEALGKILLPQGSPCPAAFRERLPVAAVAPAETVDVSSTQIRTCVREGRPIRGMVPAPVETYIRTQGLYGATVHA